MGFYEKYFLPKILNLVMKSPDLAKLRQQWVPHAYGKVLEVGIGSGLNLPFYAPGVNVVGVVPSIELQRYAEELAAKTGVAVEFLSQGCQDLPLGSNTFDCALVTWTFCTIPHPELALEEIRRVLKPDGKLIFIEHGLAKEANVANIQNKINSLWRACAGGCHLNRQPDELLVSGGFSFESLNEAYVPGPKFATYNYAGIAKIA